LEIAAGRVFPRNGDDDDINDNKFMHRKARDKEQIIIIVLGSGS
jgi:hypothetical protein